MLVRVIVAASAAVLMVAGPAVADADPNDSDLYAWGYNAGGQLGDGTNVTAPSPVKVNTSGALAGKRIRSVSGGGDHSCAIAEGTVYCWGSNGAGRTALLLGVERLRAVGDRTAGSRQLLFPHSGRRHHGRPCEQNGDSRLRRVGRNLRYRFGR